MLQHFAAKLCSFADFGTLFGAAVVSFTISKFKEFLSIMQSVHSGALKLLLSPQNKLMNFFTRLHAPKYTMTNFDRLKLGFECSFKVRWKV